MTRDPGLLRRALRVYLVTDPVLGGSRPLEETVRDAISAGVGCVQLRDKGADTVDLVRQARALLDVTRPAGALLIVNDDIDAAIDSGADGVHVGQSDIRPAAARSRIGPSGVLGVSVRTPDEAVEAEAAGADYLAANLVFPTSTKTDLPFPLGLDGVALLRRSTRLPLVAIGGIDASNAASVIAAGADGVAVVSAIMAAADVGAACRALIEAIQAPGTRHQAPGGHSSRELQPRRSRRTRSNKAPG
jgi:thiamine-phosphate pyrophosphorylase